MKKFIVFDIETLPDMKYKTALLGNICYVTWADERGVHGRDCSDLTDFFINELLTEKYDNHIIYAHNGFRFDYKRLNIKTLACSGFTGKIIKDKAHNYKAIELNKDGLSWFLQDTVIKFPSKLDSLLETFAPHLPKGELNFEKETFNSENIQHVEYAVRDSEGLYFAIERIDALFMDLFDISFHDRPTAPGLALMAFKKFCRKNKVNYPSIGSNDSIFRESYYGGQTLALDSNWHDDVMALDIHSSYGAAMLNNSMPYGNCVSFHPGEGHILRNNVLYDVDLFIPPETLPSLKSVAIIDGKKRKGNNCGYIRGKYWGIELKLAEKFGTKILDISEAWSFVEETDILQKFISHLKDLRTIKNSPHDKLGKLLQNSLYGRFAQGLIEEDTIIGFEPPENGIAEYDPGRDELMDYIWTVPRDTTKDKAAPIHWGSYITALARVNLNTAILCSPSSVLYCDTDSIFIERKNFDHFAHLIGPDYGQWGIEADKVGRFRAYAPKAYMIDGKRINKGIPKNRFEELKRQKKQDDPTISELQLSEYIATICTVEYLQHRGIHHVQKGAGLGDNQERKTAIPENISIGAFDEAGKWHPEYAGPRIDSEDLMCKCSVLPISQRGLRKGKKP